jgi:hypothetical protein
MTTSVWPNDTIMNPFPARESGNIGPITCFVASPFEPKKRWDELFQLIKDICAQISGSTGVEIKCFRADSIVSSGVIHPEIWKSLLTADFIICDVTGQNGNVMLELGIAAAWRRKEHVIILRETNDEKPRLFDINPARHLEYEISFSGTKKLAEQLSSVVQDVLANIPFSPETRKPVSLPFSARLDDSVDNKALYTEDVTHRRMLKDCLEFGAPLNYRYSWMSLGDIRLSKLIVEADLKLTLSHPNHEPFIGIMVRSQHYFANWGHLVFVRGDGKVYLNVRKNESGDYEDKLIGQVPNFDIKSFFKFKVAISDLDIKVWVNDFSQSIPLISLPYVFSAGRLLFIAGYCRMGIRAVKVEELRSSV